MNNINTIGSKELNNIIVTLCDKKNISQKETLETYIDEFLLGIMPKDAFYDLLKKNLQLDNDAVDDLVNELQVVAKNSSKTITSTSHDELKNETLAAISENRTNPAVMNIPKKETGQIVTPAKQESTLATSGTDTQTRGGGSGPTPVTTVQNPSPNVTPAPNIHEEKLKSPTIITPTISISSDGTRKALIPEDIKGKINSDPYREPLD